MSVSHRPIYKYSTCTGTPLIARCKNRYKTKVREYTKINISYAVRYDVMISYENKTEDMKF